MPEYNMNVQEDDGIWPHFLKLFAGENFFFFLTSTYVKLCSPECSLGKHPFKQAS